MKRNMKRLAIVGLVLVGVAVVVPLALALSWARDGWTAERDLEAFCATLEPGMTRSDVESAIAADSAVEDSASSFNSGGNGPQPAVIRREWVCWCSNTFVDDELRSVDSAFCID